MLHRVGLVHTCATSHTRCNTRGPHYRGGYVTRLQSAPGLGYARPLYTSQQLCIPRQDSRGSQSSPILHFFLPDFRARGSMFHPHPRPTNADAAPCLKCKRDMENGLFTEANHRCDVAACASDIPARTYGWHCAHCDVDICTTCCPYTWEVEPPSSLESYDLAMQSQHSQIQDGAVAGVDEQAALRHQEGAGAAASGRGHDA